MKVVAFGNTNLVGNKNAPYYLAKKLNYNFEDCSTESAGPQSIFRIVTKYAAMNKDFMPVIGWNNIKSIELRKVFKKEKYTGFVDPNFFTYGTDKNIDFEFRRLEKWKHILTDDYLTNIRWCTLVLSLQQLLESYDIPYLMYNIDTSIDWNEYTMNIIKNINRKTYIGVENPKANMRKYVKKLGYNFYSAEGQKCAANLLYEKMESK